MEKQPKLNLPKPRLAVFLDAVALLVFAALLMCLFGQFASLPDKVPGHYNGAGEVDRWGSKIELFILPIIGAAMWVFMSITEKYPHTFNYLNFSKEKAEAHYVNGVLMMNVLKNEIVLLFSFLTYQNIQVAIGKAEGLGAGFMPIFLAVIFGTVLLFMIRMVRI